MNSVEMILEQKKITLEKIRDILLKNGSTQETLDNVCTQIDDVLKQLIANIGK